MMKCRSAMKKNEIPTSMHLEDIMLSGKKKKNKDKRTTIANPTHARCPEAAGGVEGRPPGVGAGRRGGCSWTGARVPRGDLRKFWKRMAAMVDQHHEYVRCHRTARLKVIKMVVLCSV